MQDVNTQGNWIQPLKTVPLEWTGRDLTLDANARANAPQKAAVISTNVDDIANTAPYEEVTLDEMDYDDIDDCYYYPCPCGDRFVLSASEYAAGRRIAPCPSCTLVIRII
jgi:diphthamide biosynthesis protein 3